MQFAETFHGDGDQHHGRAEQHKTHAVEAGALAAAQVGNEAPHGITTEHADRQVDQEDPVPGQVLHHPAAHGRAEQRTEQAGDGDETHDSHQFRARVGPQHHQPAHRQHQRAAQTLYDPSADQHAQGARQRAEQRAEAEQQNRAEEYLFGAEAVGDPARGGNQQGHGEHVGDDYALHAQRVFRQIPGHGG
ncbi:hypothetical protein PS723_06667 [Pseudomonas fluorescens]|uniref:Uncharacterized protein n=1 Tax=Pseudomonas fluorescens TaxID=294 RepID=A0A5E7G3Q8_PSEFL|nr:hypothetical protein PS723_06667 [Pseudomonas fluorescens]